MASHAQIRKNIRDVNSAWGQLQGFLQAHLPGSASSIYSWARAVNIKRRY